MRAAGAMMTAPSTATRQLRDFGEPIELARKLYDRGEQQLRDPAARLRWAEGIVREFGDVEWAGRVYEELVNAFEAGQRSVYDYSRETWLTRNRQR